MKTSVFADNRNHFHGQLNPGVIFSTIFPGGFRVQVQSKQNGQTERSVGAQWESNNHTNHNPAVGAAREFPSTAGDPRMHSGAEDLQATVVNECVAHGQKNDVPAEWLNQIEHRQLEAAQRLGYGGEELVKQ